MQKLLLTLFVVFCCNTFVYATVKQPDFSSVLSSYPTKENIYDAIETLSGRDGEAEYSDLLNTVNSLMTSPATRMNVISALKQYPVRSLLGALTDALPDKWNGATNENIAVVEALAKLGGGKCSEIISTELGIAIRENADKAIISRIIDSLILSDPGSALNYLMNHSRFKYSNSIDDFWKQPIIASIKACLNKPNFDPYIISVSRYLISSRLRKENGHYKFDTGVESVSKDIFTELATSLATQSSIPALSALIFYNLTDDINIQTIAGNVNYGAFAGAPWLASNPKELTVVLSENNNKVRSILAQYDFPCPDVYPFGTGDHQALLRSLHELKGPLSSTTMESFNSIHNIKAKAIDEIDKYIFYGISTLYGLPALQKARLPLNNNANELFWREESQRLASVVSFALGEYNLQGPQELRTAQFMVNKEFERLATVAYAILRSQSWGVNIGKRGSIADIDTLLDSLSTLPAREYMPVSVSIKTLPDLNGTVSLPTNLSCKNPLFSTKERTLALDTAQFLETSRITCPDSSSSTIRWVGNVPLYLLPCLQRHPRLLDFLGINLTARELISSSQSPNINSDDLDIVLRDTEKSVPLLYLLWNGGEISWNDVKSTLLADEFDNNTTVSPLPFSPDPALPSSLAYLSQSIPPSGIYSETEIHSLSNLFKEQVGKILAAKGKSTVCTFASNIVSARLSDRIWQQYVIPCDNSSAGGQVSYCTGYQYGNNPQKVALLNHYGNGVKQANNEIKTFKAWDLESLSGQRIEKIVLLRGWISGNVRTFLGLYLLKSQQGDRVTFAEVSLDKIPQWLRSTILSSPSILFNYRLDLAGATAGNQKNASLIAIITEQMSQFAELRQKDHLAFDTLPSNPIEISLLPLKKTPYGQFRTRQVGFARTLSTLTPADQMLTDETVNPDFSTKVFTSWKEAVRQVSQNVEAEKARVNDELNRAIEQPFSIGISVTFGALPIPLFGLTASSGSWSAVLTTNFSNMFSFFPTWNGIGIPILVGTSTAPGSTGSSPPGPAEASPSPADIAPATPLPKAIVQEQVGSAVYTSSRAGNSLLSAPACYVDLTTRAQIDPTGYFAFVYSLVENIPNWSKQKVEGFVGAFQRCKSARDDMTPCNFFVLDVVRNVFNLTDFEGIPGDFTRANQLADFLAQNPLWEKLGTASSQDALNKAQAEANNGNAVIAVWKNPDPNKMGHVALVIPGSLTQSGERWNYMMVPNAAQTRNGDKFGDVSGVWIGRPLFFSFGHKKQNDVVLYVRR